MWKQIEGSRAVAETVALCRPEVICAYPITPQTHIVEGLADLVRGGELANCEFINVESEFAALSVAIGASAAGARAYTATSSQGLLFMAEAVYNASGLGLPIVMTIGNRAIGAPINIWNDHSDSMSMRDGGWIQLYAETNQEAADLHIQAFRLAEALSCPVMVCMDGFILTHAFERVDIPDQAAVDAFLPAFDPRQALDPAHPLSIGAMVGPEAFMEVRYLQHHKQLEALALIPRLETEFARVFGRNSGGLLRSYRTEGAEAIGSISICSYRPFPLAALREAAHRAKRVIVIEKDLAVGVGGIVAMDVRKAMAGLEAPVYTVIAGLGGRSITQDSLRTLFGRAAREELEAVTFLDLNWSVVRRQLDRENAARRSGPAAESILRDLGVTGGGAY